MKLIAAIVGALGALAFWRRKSLKEDSEKVVAAGKDAATKANARLRGEGAAESADDASDDSPAESSGEESSDDGTDAGEESDSEAEDA